MNCVLAFPLIVAILSRGHSLVTVTGGALGTCFQICPPGYHKSGECSDPSDGTARYKCEKCGTNSFTDEENFTPKCERCSQCGTYQDQIKSCSFNSNVKCECRRGYYNADRSPSRNNMDCKPCISRNKKIPSSNTPGYHEYIRKCKTTSTPPASTAPTNTTTPFWNATTATTWTSAVENPKMNPVPPNGAHVSWLVWLAVTFAIVCGLLLLRRLFGAPESCFYWRIRKAVPLDPRPNAEQPSHQDNTSTTLTVNESEGTPFMSYSQSPSTSEHPAPACVLLPSSEPRAAKQDEQSKDWPAIVLYAIIKEVPLRRWKEFLRLLSVADEQLERVELEAGLGPGSMERQYQMLRLWSQRASASMDDVFSALHYMNLSRCAELLEENLENLPWRTDTKQGITV